MNNDGHRPVCRDQWRETVRCELLLAGAKIEALPSGSLRITAKGECVLVSDLAHISQRSLREMTAPQ
ncbi:hypothetical protein BH11PSE11_BH11PSE11_12260 [soil metagenome]